jgi:DNA (cytosine-5)-methyltransferase 1
MERTMIFKEGWAMLLNHYGYELRNDEKPYAHKIPPGGNWRSLPVDEQKAFMGNAFYSPGGKTVFLRREAWNEPAHTIVASQMGKATCLLHPGTQLNIARKDMRLFIERYNGLTVAELFAGGGLMAAGFRAAGYGLRWANDFEKTAVEAYGLNIHKNIVHGDITKMSVDDIPNTDVIIGGPPCQDFSAAGKDQGETGERGKLVYAYLNVIREKKPMAFMFENVAGLASKTHRHTLDELLTLFRMIGYNVTFRIVNAWDYGVAQKRERVFIIGIRDDLNKRYIFPKPNSGEQRTRVLSDVIGDLPLLTADRRFTVRECLRIQSVPDDYYFPDTMRLDNQYKIVGNGVPSYLAYQLAKQLALSIRER